MTPSGVYTRHDWPNIPGASVRRGWGGRQVAELSCDVAIVGSGAGGGVIAAELAQAGLDVVVIEEGGYFSTESFNTDNGAGIRNLYRDGGVQMALGKPPITFAEGRCVGGSTVINGGMSWRTPERVLERWTQEHWVDRGSLQQMEPYFQRVERYISTAYQDPWTIGRDNQLLKEASDRKGWEVIPNLRDQLHCAGTNRCAFGCPTGAKRSTLVSYLPRALHFGARILANCRVEKLIRQRKRVLGVQGRVTNPDGSLGQRFVVRAKLTFSCAGAVQTPSLLFRSGIRSPSGRLGKGLTLHPNTKVVALFDEDVSGWKGVHQAYQVREFRDEGYLMAAINLPPALVAMSLPHYGAELNSIMRDYNNSLVAGVLIEDTTSGVVRNVAGEPVSTYALSELDRQRMVRGTALLCELMLEAGAKRIVLPFAGIPDLVDADGVRRLFSQEIPLGSMEVVTVHIMGTAGMGGDPTRHVCDSYGRVYDTEGLCIADASLFPSPIGVNPMETIMTLATRNAERVIDAGLSQSARQTSPQVRVGS